MRLPKVNGDAKVIVSAHTTVLLLLAKRCVYDLSVIGINYRKMIAQTVLTTTAVTTENIALQSQTKITETTTVTSTQTAAQNITATAPTTTVATPIVTTTATAKTTSTAAITVQTTAKTEFDINSQIKFAIDYAEGVGLEIDEAAKDCWDNPIMANEKCIYLERDIKSRLDLYSQNPDISAVWIWAKEVSYGNYELYIGYA